MEDPGRRRHRSLFLLALWSESCKELRHFASSSPQKPQEAAEAPSWRFALGTDRLNAALLPENLAPMPVLQCDMCCGLGVNLGTYGILRKPPVKHDKKCRGMVEDQVARFMR